MDHTRWTPAAGLQQAGRHLAIRTAVAFAAWAVLMLVLGPVIAAVAVHWVVLALGAVALGVPGMAIAQALGRDLVEVAGMTSLLLTAVAILCGWGVVIGGATLADLIWPTMADWQFGFVTIATGVWVTLGLFRLTLLET